MSVTEHWLSLLPMIRAAGPVDLDPTLSAKPASPVTAATFPQRLDDGPPPSARLWQQASVDHSCIGVRVLHPLADAAPVALRLAAAAVERQVVPIILTPLAVSGFERFGFRCERLFGATEAERAVCEVELVRFWSMAIVIDAEDVALLG